MKIIIPTDDDGKMTSLDDIKNAIFLAGPCPRKNYDVEDKWRKEAIDILKEIGFEGCVLNPTNKNYPKMKDITKQTEWEEEAMKKASAIVFWLPRSEEHPGFTSNIEIGYWVDKPGVYIGFPDEDKDKNSNPYIEVKAKQNKKKIYKTLKDMILDVTYDLDQDDQIWFTSDTHFGAERTLELSRRPFNTVREMDLEMISNWNKRIHPNDTVYHLGDFGNYDVLKCLNGKIKIIKGNYEKDKKDVPPKDFKDLYENDEITLKSPKDNFEYTLRHEPLEPKGTKEENKDKFFLFGHIHGRTMYKRNGLDVGIDAYNYKPINMEEVDWRRIAITKYVDENVFTDYCK